MRFTKNYPFGFSPFILFLVMSILAGLPVVSLAGGKKPVNLRTFVRAETDVTMKNVYDKIGLGKLVHLREPTPVDKQDIIRMNRDTIYSSAILDLSKPATVSMPDAEGRYMSLQVINQDHYTFAVSRSGDYKLTREEVGSRYAYLIIRTFVDSDDPADIKAANEAQDAIKIEGGDGTFEVPDWDMEQLQEARTALNALANLGGNSALAFGKKDEVNPIDHLVYTAAGWGGLPQTSAFYELGNVAHNDGTPYTLTVKDVPVDAFWSVTVYGEDGFIKPNDAGRYSFNNVTAAPNDDGSVTINFGGCDDGRINCLPAPQGWNYAVRLYEPRPEILDGTWKFPEASAVQ